jgi:hypothetical protein
LGGQWRIPKAEVERLKQEGLPPVGRPLPDPEGVPIRSRRSNGVLLAEPSEHVIDAAEEVVVLENEVKAIALKRQKEEGLDWFREREDRQAKREWEQEEAERERRAQAEATREREQWEAKWLEYGLDGIPRDVPTDSRLDVHQAVEQALSTLQPSQPESIVRRLIEAAVERALRPWRRRKEIQGAIERACAKLPWDITHGPEFRECKQLAIQNAEAAIATLSQDASYRDLEATAIDAMRPSVEEYEHLKKCERIVSSVWLATGSGELEEAKDAVKQALAALPTGVPPAQIEKARDAALAPYQAKIAERDWAAEQQRREQTASFTAGLRVDLVLAGDIRSYLEKEFEYDPGYDGTTRRQKDTERIRKKIREAVIKECIARPNMTPLDLHRKIERLASKAD